jgi:hypothetical protein
MPLPSCRGSRDQDQVGACSLSGHHPQGRKGAAWAEFKSDQTVANALPMPLGDPDAGSWPSDLRTVMMRLVFVLKSNGCHHLLTDGRAQSIGANDGRALGHARMLREQNACDTGCRSTFSFPIRPRGPRSPRNWVLSRGALTTGQAAIFEIARKREFLLSDRDH